MSSTVVETLRQTGMMAEAVERNSLACIPGLEGSSQPYQILHVSKYGEASPSEVAAMLQNLQSPHSQSRSDAERRLEWMAGSGFGRAARLLAVEVNNPLTPLATRRTAAIVLKNLLRGEMTSESHDRWCSMDQQQRAEVTMLLLSALCSETKELGLSAAQVVAEMARQELLSTKWTDLVPTLTGRLQSRELSCSQKETALTCLGYILEEAGSSGQALPKQAVDQVLTASTAGLRDVSQALGTRVAAGKALCAAIPCAGLNFEEPHERDYLMQVLLDSCGAAAEEVRAVAFECIEATCGTHLETMGKYMEALASASARCIYYDSEQVASLAIDSWCTACSLILHKDGEAPGLSQKAVQQLCEALLTRLTQQPEGEDADELEGSIAWGAAECLTHLTAVYGDHTLCVCDPFIKEKESSEDWRSRDAAAVVIGASSSGLKAEQVSRVAPSLVPLVFERLAAEPHVRVQRSLLWAAGCVFEAVAEAPDVLQLVFQGDSFQQCLQSLRAATRCPVLVAEMACDSLAKLMVAAQSAMAPALAVQHFAPVVGCLLSVAESSQPPPEQLRLRMAAFGAVKDVVEASPTECCPLLADLVEVVARQLQDGTRRLDTLATRQSLNPMMSAYMKRMRDLQEFLCSVLNVILLRVKQEPGLGMLSRLPPCQDLMATLRRVLDHQEGSSSSSSSSASSSSSSSSMEVLPLMATMSALWGADFQPHLPTMWTPLYSMAQDRSDTQGCVMALEVICGMYSSQQVLMAPYHLHVLQLLELHMDSGVCAGPEAPACLTLLGYVANAMGEQFLPYLEKGLSVVCHSAEAWTRSVGSMTPSKLLGDDARQLQLAVLSSLCYLLESVPSELIVGPLQGTAAGQHHVNAILTMMEASSNRLTAETGLPSACQSVRLLWFMASRVPSARLALQQRQWPLNLLQQWQLLPDLHHLAAATAQMLQL